MLSELERSLVHGGVYGGAGVIINSFVVNRSGASLKKRASVGTYVTPVLLNVLDSTRYYVGSYLRDADARLRPSKDCHTT